MGVQLSKEVYIHTLIIVIYNRPDSAGSRRIEDNYINLALNYNYVSDGKDRTDSTVHKWTKQIVDGQNKYYYLLKCPTYNTLTADMKSSTILNVQIRQIKIRCMKSDIAKLPTTNL